MDPIRQTEALVADAEKTLIDLRALLVRAEENLEAARDHLRTLRMQRDRITEADLG